MIQIKIFTSRNDNESLKTHQDKINKWLKRNQKIKFISTKFYHSYAGLTTIFLFESTD